MRKQIHATVLGLVLSFSSFVAFEAKALEADSVPLCAAVSSSLYGSIADIFEGRYTPNSSNSYFCESYRITGVGKHSCSGAVTFLTLHCEKAGKVTDSWQMNCRGGVCETSTGERKLTLSNATSKEAAYVSNGHTTNLVRFAPCP